VAGRRGDVDRERRGRLGVDQEKAEATAAELEERDLVRLGGGHSVTLTEAGRQLVKKR
jgi:Mn-dependent DtxR family transcriptional regulator